MAQSPAAMLAELERFSAKAPPEGRVVVMILRRDAVPGDPEASKVYLAELLRWREQALVSGDVRTLFTICLHPGILPAERPEADPFS